MERLIPAGEREETVSFFSFVRSVEFAYVFAWFTADSGHSFVRYSFQEIHLVNCDFSFVVSDGRQRSTFRFQIVWQCFKHFVRNHRLM